MKGRFSLISLSFSFWESVVKNLKHPRLSLVQTGICVPLRLPIVRLNLPLIPTAGVPDGPLLRTAEVLGLRLNMVQRQEGLSLIVLGRGNAFSGEFERK